MIVRNKDLAEVDKYWADVGQKATGLAQSAGAENWFMPVALLLGAPFQVFVVDQRPGDLILIPSSCPHQVQ